MITAYIGTSLHRVGTDYSTAACKDIEAEQPTLFYLDTAAGVAAALELLSGLTGSFWLFKVHANGHGGGLVDVDRARRILENAIPSDLSPAEANARVLALVDPQLQELIRARYPQLEQLPAWSSRRIDFSKLPVSILHQCAKLNPALVLTCGRCGGSGSYSRCERWGTTCFKCGTVPGVPGSGKVFAPFNTRYRRRYLKAAAELAADAGELKG